MTAHHEVFPVTPDWQKRSHITSAKYRELYKYSVEDPEGFWAEQAQRLTWTKPWEKVKEVSFEDPVTIKWFQGGKLNLCFNCVDRHLDRRANQVAFHWEPDDDGKCIGSKKSSSEAKKITYQGLHDAVGRWANALKRQGVKKGDRVTLYLPMIPEAIYSMLACARIGAVHSVVFAGFSPEALADRIRDCESEWLITADEGLRGGRTVPLKENADKAADMCPDLKKVFVVKWTAEDVNWNPLRDVWYHEAIDGVSTHCECEEMDAEDPLFILYTSGSTNKPKGVLHTTGGYLTYASLTHKYVFDYHDGEVYWCAADVGWVTGHSYIVYGPLSNGATSVMFEGVPTYPTASRLWEIIDKYEVNTLYTAPTLIRALMQQGEEPVKKTSRESLRLLGSVGEPINPEAWLWYYKVAGDSRCPIVDTWWQTETGGIMISPLPGATNLKPGSATLPFFGIQPQIVSSEGDVLEGNKVEGQLVVTDSWPGQMRGVYKDPQRFFDTYFSQYPGKYFTGDGCRRDEDGFYWITGRVDDVLNVAGHRMGTAEVESSLVEHPAVAEAAVVGFPHEIKGQGIYAFVTLVDGALDGKNDSELRLELQEFVKRDIGSFAKPEKIQFSPALPKTRSGKIMRRILRKIAANEWADLGDTSTLAEPAVVYNLIEGRQ